MHYVAFEQPCVMSSIFATANSKFTATVAVAGALFAAATRGSLHLIK
jgi:hypothetical protein